MGDEEKENKSPRKPLRWKPTNEPIFIGLRRRVMVKCCKGIGVMKGLGRRTLGF